MLGGPKTEITKIAASGESTASPSSTSIHKLGVIGEVEASTHSLLRQGLLFLGSQNRDRGDGHPSSPPTPPYMRVRIRRFSELSPRGPEVRGVVRHKGFAALQVSVSASPSSEPVKLSRS
jgi:hypothetical protein